MVQEGLTCITWHMTRTCHPMSSCCLNNTRPLWCLQLWWCVVSWHPLTPFCLVVHTPWVLSARWHVGRTLHYIIAATHQPSRLNVCVLAATESRRRHGEESELSVKPQRAVQLTDGAPWNHSRGDSNHHSYITHQPLSISTKHFRKILIFELWKMFFKGL